MHKLTVVILSLMLLFTITPLAYAHVLKTSGSVGAVVHVSPEDDPIAGEITDFFFEFKDRENKFRPENCDCKVTVLRSGQEVYSGDLFQNSTNPSLTNASFSYTFPEKDIYKVNVIGNPTSPGAFEAFNLEYDIRVARESENITQTNQTTSNSETSGFGNWILTHIPHLIGGFIVLAFLIFALIKQQSNSKNK